MGGEEFVEWTFILSTKKSISLTIFVKNHLKRRLTFLFVCKTNCGSRLCCMDKGTSYLLLLLATMK